MTRHNNRQSLSQNSLKFLVEWPLLLVDLWRDTGWIVTALQRLPQSTTSTAWDLKTKLIYCPITWREHRAHSLIIPQNAALSWENFPQTQPERAAGWRYLHHNKGDPLKLLPSNNKEAYRSEHCRQKHPLLAVCLSVRIFRCEAENYLYSLHFVRSYNVEVDIEHVTRQEGAV